MQNLILLIILFLGNLNLIAQSEIKYLDEFQKETPKRKAYYKMQLTTNGDTVFKEFFLINDNRLVKISKNHTSNTDLVYVKTFSNELIVNEGWLILNAARTGDWKFYNKLGQLKWIKSYANGREIYFRSFYPDLKLKKEVVIKRGVYNGKYILYNNKGKVIVEGIYENDKKDGRFRYFNDSGILIKSRLYIFNEINGEDSLFENGKFFKKPEDIKSPPKTQKDTNVYLMPTFKGGESEMMKYIYENIEYPVEAINSAIEGIVRVKFTVKPDGTIAEVDFINKEFLGYGCERQAIEVIESMPDWNPGLTNGIPVPVYFNLPVRFKLF